MAIYNATRANYDRVINWEEALDFLGELFKSSNNDDKTKSKLPGLLFRKVVNNNSFVFERWWNYIHLFDASLRLNLSVKYGFLSRLVSVKMLLLQLSLILLISPVVLGENLFITITKLSIFEFNSDTFLNKPFSFILTFLGGIIFSFVYFNLVFPRFRRYSKRSSLKFSIGDKLSLWLLLIKSIGVTSNDLEDSFGKNISKALPQLYSLYNLKERIIAKNEFVNGKTNANTRS